MRSNDAVFGFCNDVFTFCMFQQLMLNDLNKILPPEQKLSLGEYYHSAGSFHIYETHWKMMDKILENYYVKVSKEGWPRLNKWKLRNIITSDNVEDISMPIAPMSKSSITSFTRSIKENMYE